jgi:hypothetical protein
MMRIETALIPPKRRPNTDNDNAVPVLIVKDKQLQQKIFQTRTYL